MITSGAIVWCSGVSFDLYQEDFPVKKVFSLMIIEILVAAVAAMQTASAQAPAGDLQRSANFYNYRSAASTGPPRGEQMYYFKY